MRYRTRAILVSLLSFTGAVLAEKKKHQQYAGYLFAYVCPLHLQVTRSLNIRQFLGEGTSTGERIYFSTSTSDNPMQWTPVNGGQAVLNSTLGTTGLRDPTIIRSHDGTKAWIIATDLKINGNGNWNAALR